MDPRIRRLCAHPTTTTTTTKSALTTLRTLHNAALAASALHLPPSSSSSSLSHTLREIDTFVHRRADRFFVYRGGAYRAEDVAGLVLEAHRLAAALRERVRVLRGPCYVLSDGRRLRRGG